MSSMELFKILGEIDNRFYEEALASEIADDGKPIKLNVSSGRKNPFRVAAIAAAACLIIGAGAGLAIYLNTRGVDIVQPNTSEYCGEFSATDIADCKQQILAAYPELEQYEQDGDMRALQTRAMDINCDGTEEAVFFSKAQKQLFVFVKTKDGMTLTDTVNMPGSVFCVGDINDLYRYDEDGESYWYYGIHAGNNDRYNDVNAMGRIVYENGSYAVDFPLAYGSVFGNRDLGFGQGVFYKTDWDYTEGLKELSDIDPHSNITREEFEALWSKHKGLPELALDFFSEYPLIPSDGNKIPVVTDTSDMSGAADKARIDLINYGNDSIWLVGESIYRKSSSSLWDIRLKNLEIAIVKNNKIVSKEKINIASAAPDKLGYIELENPAPDDKYLQLYQLKDTQILVFSFTNGEDTPGEDPERESAFFAVRDDKLIPLMGTMAVGGSEIGYSAGAGDSLVILGNSLLDEENGMVYTFAPENFDKDPNTAPHFTTEEYDNNSLGIGKYVKYDPSSSEMVLQALLTEKTVGGNTVKLLGHNVQTIHDEFPHTKYSNLYIAIERNGEQICKKEIISDMAYDLDADRLDDYIFTFEMKDGIGFGLYTAYGYGNSQGAFRYAWLYAIKDEAINLTRPFDYAPIDHNSPAGGFWGGYTIVPNENKIVFNEGGSIILDFNNNNYSVEYGTVSVKGGKALISGMGPEFDMPYIDSECGTETEWKRWTDMLTSGEIDHIDTEKWYTNTEGVLSDAAAEQIINLLSNAQMKLFENEEEMWDNMAVGGSDFIYAYDKNGSLILEIVYNGYWLTARFADSGIQYRFNGVNCGLDDLSSLMPGG